jgi:hypothetical protein
MSRSKTHVITVASCIAISPAAVLPASCSKKSPDDDKKTAQKSEDDFLGKDAKPEERKYLLAAKPFFIAVAGRKYADAYVLLSSHDRARMSFNQFMPAEEQTTFQQYESNPYSNVTAEQFAYLIQYVQAARGTPRAPKMLHVLSTDPDVLSRRSRKQIRSDGRLFRVSAAVHNGLTLLLRSSKRNRGAPTLRRTLQRVRLALQWSSWRTTISFTSITTRLRR